MRATIRTQAESHADYYDSHGILTEIVGGDVPLSVEVGYEFRVTRCGLGKTANSGWWRSVFRVPGYELRVKHNSRLLVE